MPHSNVAMLTGLLLLLLLATGGGAQQVINGLVCPVKEEPVPSGSDLWTCCQQPNTTYLLAPGGNYTISKQIFPFPNTAPEGLCYIAEGPGVTVSSQVQVQDEDRQAFVVTTQLGLKGFVLDGSASNGGGVLAADEATSKIAAEDMVLQGWPVAQHCLLAKAAMPGATAAS